jgi:hypothetical protein
MSANRRHVGSLVRGGNLLGVLVWHAVLGAVCLVRGREGFEALQPAWVQWAVVIMLGSAALVMLELAWKSRAHRGVEPVVSAVSVGFVIATLAGWVWLATRPSVTNYDELAGLFSRGFGGNIDLDTGLGFAGMPWLPLPYLVGLSGYCLRVDAFSQAVSKERGDNWLRAVRGVMWVTALSTFGGVVHLATGTRLLGW